MARLGCGIVKLMNPTNLLPKEPTLFSGAVATDDRGCLRFVNSFSFQGVRRFYQVENHDTAVVRAWHGHLKEAKYVYAAAGSAIVAAVVLDDTHKPNPKNQVQRFVLSANQPSVLFIPAGYANGFRMLNPETKLQFFSTSTLEASQGDDYRFPFDYWGEEVWQVINR